jgi:hypothetical protein
VQRPRRTRRSFAARLFSRRPPRPQRQRGRTHPVRPPPSSDRQHDTATAGAGPLQSMTARRPRRRAHLLPRSVHARGRDVCVDGQEAGHAIKRPLPWRHRSLSGGDQP